MTVVYAARIDEGMSTNSSEWASTLPANPGSARRTWRTLFIIAQCVLAAVFALAFFFSTTVFAAALAAVSTALSAAYIALRIG